jgi:hypothetical protein
MASLYALAFDEAVDERRLRDRPCFSVGGATAVAPENLPRSLIEALDLAALDRWLAKGKVGWLALAVRR